MSRYSGPQIRGAAGQRRDRARAEAGERDALTLPERRASFRRERARLRAALDERELAALRASLEGAPR